MSKNNGASLSFEKKEGEKEKGNQIGEPLSERKMLESLTPMRLFMETVCPLFRLKIVKTVAFFNFPPKMNWLLKLKADLVGRQQEMALNSIAMSFRSS